MDLRALHRMLRSFFNVREGKASNKIIQRRIQEDATIDGIHVCQLIAAMLIASIGLNLDSTEAVIGAMLICPLMGSVMAIAYSVATVDTRYLRDSVTGLVVQVAVCLATSTLYFVLSPISHATSELLTNSTATVWDVLIAFVGGFAGALGTSRRQEPTTLIAGVAVATALMPPLCSAGYGIALRDLGLAASAFYEFLINVVFIAFGAQLVLVWLRMPLQLDLDGDGVVTQAEAAAAKARSHAMRKQLVIGSLVFALPCTFFSAQVIQTAMAENGTVFEVHDEFDTEITTYELHVVCPDLVDYRIGTEDSYDMESQSLKQQVVATVETSGELDGRDRKRAEEIIRIHVPDLSAVTFEVSPDDAKATET